MSPATIRINRYLSMCGVASRRKADDLIRAGKVEVNGETPTDPGFTIDPDRDRIVVNGRQIVRTHDHLYLVLNKPKDAITTTQDERGRPTVMQHISARRRVYPVGRLDRNTTGVLLFTDDGEFANRLMHPRYHVPKTYLVTCSDTVTREHLRNLAEGVALPDGTTAPAEIGVVGGSKASRIVITIREGRNRQVRRMFEHLGYEVTKLDRVAYGPVTVDGLPRGASRSLTPQEVRTLRRMAGMDAAGEEEQTSGIPPAAAPGGEDSTAERRHVRGSRAEHGRTPGAFPRGSKRPPGPSGTGNRGFSRPGGGAHPASGRGQGRTPGVYAGGVQRHPASRRGGKGEFPRPGDGAHPAPERGRGRTPGGFPGGSMRPPGPSGGGKRGFSRPGGRAHPASERGEGRRPGVFPGGVQRHPAPTRGGKPGFARPGGGAHPASGRGQGRRPGDFPGGEKRHAEPRGTGKRGFSRSGGGAHPASERGQGRAPGGFPGGAQRHPAPERGRGHASRREYGRTPNRPTPPRTGRRRG